MSFTNLYTLIATKQKAIASTTPATPDPTIFFDFGRVVRLLVIFDPNTGSGFNGMQVGNGKDQESIKSMPDGSYFIENATVNLDDDFTSFISDPTENLTASG